MRKVLFLDRDGVINNDSGHYYIYRPDDFVLNEGFVEAMQKLALAGYEFIVISNQGGIARGTYSKADVEKVHSKFLSLMDDVRISILDIYYCPHHSDFEKCLCRKPGSLLIEKAMARYTIDANSAIFIGDNDKDMEAARNAGIRGIRIKSNQSLITILSELLNGR
ncbi:MAG: HAD family hydrolase [Bacteroidetes bacterium HGW-Bacteroidetes-4]|jgi:D-glycero-D-manno-heptose 1,7-bisphosphate phosphatase|nr:MAG: HAD family hydrolase [Bacteroidetes bacterium HGW-Bacteroidetes-4]